MNYEGWGEFEQPLFAQHPKLRELEEQLYGHVLDAIDWDRIAALEQSTYELLVGGSGFDPTVELDKQLALDLSSALMTRALQRAADDGSRYGSVGTPFGVTEAEAKAVAFEASCPFCVVEREMESRPKVHELADEEPCPCCEDLVQTWREEHREVLEKAGLWKEMTS